MGNTEQWICRFWPNCILWAGAALHGAVSSGKGVCNDVREVGK